MEIVDKMDNWLCNQRFQRYVYQKNRFYQKYLTYGFTLILSFFIRFLLHSEWRGIGTKSLSTYSFLIVDNWNQWFDASFPFLFHAERVTGDSRSTKRTIGFATGASSGMYTWTHMTFYQKNSLYRFALICFWFSPFSFVFFRIQNAVALAQDHPVRIVCSLLKSQLDLHWFSIDFLFFPIVLFCI